MLVTIKEDAKVLIPHPEHKNFIEIDDFISEGNLVHGQYKEIKGLRRGQPFVYKLFLTDDGKLIYKNKTQPMNTEVNLGADASQTGATLNLVPAEKTHKDKFYGVLIGGAAGFAYAKYRKHDMKNSAMWIGVGALVGYLASYLMDKNKAAVITPSK